MLKNSPLGQKMACYTLVWNIVWLYIYVLAAVVMKYIFNFIQVNGGWSMTDMFRYVHQLGTSIYLVVLITSSLQIRLNGS